MILAKIHVFWYFIWRSVNILFFNKNPDTYLRGRLDIFWGIGREIGPIKKGPDEIGRQIGLNEIGPDEIGPLKKKIKAVLFPRQSGSISPIYFKFHKEL